MANKELNSGQLLWHKAKKIIPGGNQLLSKRPEMFLPDIWPTYYSKAKGCEIWDLDGNRYFDFATMGIGSCTLGYADEDVNNKVQESINHGSMSTLNSPEEVQLAEKLVNLHPWSDMARFSRTGGEACAIALRIARAATGKDKVAFCGYHGWHDWYIASNISDKNNLNKHLLAGLDSKGVVKNLKGTAIPFLYNDLESLKKIIEQNKNEIAAIIMEPVRDSEPSEGFLEAIREIATNERIVLIFDEVTSGFRKNIGGIHLILGVEPDIAVFGKALGNGFPISAVIGRSNTMNAAQDTFISSTNWTEKIGFVAALSTIEKYEEHNVPEYLVAYGKRINEGWLRAANESGVQIKISGLEPLTHIEFLNDDSVCIQTLYTQEMLKKGYLLGGGIYTTFAYDNEIIDKFVNETVSVFKYIREAIESSQPETFLDGKIKHTGFNRLA